jgi:hypothetical protein
MTASGEPEMAWRVNNWSDLAKIDTKLNFDKGKNGRYCLTFLFLILEQLILEERMED